MNITTGDIEWYVYAKNKATGQHESAGPFTAAYLAFDHADKHYPEATHTIAIKGKFVKVACER